MGKFRKTIQFLFKYKARSLFIVFFIFTGTILEGISVGMLIPFLQQVILPDATILLKIPLLNKFISFYGYADTRKILFFILFFIFFLILFKNLFIFHGKKLIWRLRFSIYGDLQEELFGSLMTAGFLFFDVAKSGYIMHAFNRETEKVATYMFNFLTLMSVIIQIIVYMVVLTFISWKLCLVSLFLIIFTFPVIHFIRRRKEILSALSNKAQAGVNFVLTEILTGIRTIKLFVAEQNVAKWFKKERNNFLHTEYKANVWQELLAPIFEIMIIAMILIGFFLTVGLFKVDLSKVLPQLIAFMWILFRALNQLNNFNHYRTEMAGCIGAFDSYEELLSKVKEYVLPNGKIKIEHFFRQIEFKSVCFKYADNIEVLKNISFLIPKGKITAIVGGSGAGKSTIVNLIPRLYEVTKGEITVDGININELDYNSWRNKIGFVSQDVFIFNATIRENIIFGFNEATDEDIIRAAQMANIHNYIMSLPQGYATFVGERGAKLSGGQKQMIAIARTVIRNPEILILDEATSALDTESESLVQEAIDRLSHNHTVIVIAHRLSTIQNADKIVVLENGMVAEEGMHDELLRRKGRYSFLYNTQLNKLLDRKIN